MEAFPAAEVLTLKAGSILILKNSRGLMTRGGPAAVRTMEAKLAQDPEVFPNIEALLEKYQYRDVMPVATSKVSAAQHYRSVFSRNADLPAAMVRFQKDPALIDAP